MLVFNVKHLQDTIDTEFKLPFLFLMWTFTSYFQFDMKAHISQLKCELSDYILFLMWSHHTGNTWKILWIQDLNFQACFQCESPDYVIFFMWNHTFNNGNICKKLWILWNLLIKWEAKLTNLSEIYTYKMRSKVENSQWNTNVTPPIENLP